MPCERCSRSSPAIRTHAGKSISEIESSEGLKALFQLLKNELPQKPIQGTRQHAPDASPSVQARIGGTEATPSAARVAGMGEAIFAETAEGPDAITILHRAAEAGEARANLTQMLARSDMLHDPSRGEFKPLLAVEFPIAIRGEMTTAEFHIDREAEGAETPEGKIWQARFSIDHPDGGMIHARAGLRGESLSATLWAEDADTAARMREAAGMLDAALSEQGFEVLDLRILHGRPAYKAGPAAGQFLQSIA
jgi:hypothetical protein